MAQCLAGLDVGADGVYAFLDRQTRKPGACLRKRCVAQAKPDAAFSIRTAVLKVGLKTRIPARSYWRAATVRYRSEVAAPAIPALGRSGC